MDWLICWQIRDWVIDLIYWVLDWLIDWLIGLLTKWLSSWFDWLGAWLVIDWLVAKVIDWLIDLIDWVLACLFDRLNGYWLIGWSIDCPTWFSPCWGVLPFAFCPSLVFVGWCQYRRRKVGQKLSDPVEIEFPSLVEASAAEWGSLKDRWGPPPKPFVVAQRECLITCLRFLSNLCCVGKIVKY